MPAIVRPTRGFSFADWSKSRPREQIPGDQLDAQIQNLIDAIHSTQLALAQIMRDDGRLRNQSVELEQLAPMVEQALTADVRETTLKNAIRAEQGAAVVRYVEDNVALIARDAEAAAISAAQFLSAVNVAHELVERNTHRVINATDVVDAQTSDAENWANYSQAQAENAIKAKDEALQWAEYLAGPVVNAADAPAYIQDSPWGHGLYYQPVEGGLAGLWSSKWWALYAQQLVGNWGFYYLGAWAEPPMPGQTNPETGVTTPNPLLPGSFYYNTSNDQLYVWDGGEWKSPYVLTPAYQDNFVYIATAGQTAFAGPDKDGKIPRVGNNPSDVHLNGVRLVMDVDYAVDAPTSTMTLAVPATANSIVQWDLLVETSQLTPGAVLLFKVQISPAPDGAVTAFTMTYNNPTQGPLPVDATANAQLMVSLDGVVQEPGVDFNAAGDVLTMSAAPLANSRFWASWHANEVLVLPSGAVKTK